MTVTFRSSYWHEGTCLDDNGRIIDQQAANDRDDLRVILRTLNERDDRVRGIVPSVAILAAIGALVYYGPRFVAWLLS